MASQINTLSNTNEDQYWLISGQSIDEFRVMRIHLIAVGQRMPDWVEHSFEDYAKRLPKECSLELSEINAEKRVKSANLEKIKLREGDRILSAVPKSAHIVALDALGKQWTTPELSQQLETWLHMGTDIALLVGGPEGLSQHCKQAARQQWSLSKLTLPHPMVRVIVAEQLFRAWAILNNHPYHR